MAPPFLALGGDSDDESKSVIEKLSEAPSLSTRPRRNIDSDSDDDRSSISLSDMPINPPAPDFLLDLGRQLTKEDEEKQPLSTPPSPFLSKEIYLDCHRLALDQVCSFVVFHLVSNYICIIKLLSSCTESNYIAFSDLSKCKRFW